MTADPLHRTRDRCRACDETELVRFLELGPQAPANALLVGEEDFAAERAYPLDVWFCPRCSLVQLLDVVDPEVLFGHYLYLTGTSSTMSAHFRAYADALTVELSLTADDLVVEVASNDGSLLAGFAAHGVRTLGIEPARNVAAIARERGVDTIDRFFDETVAAEVRAERGPASLAVANNVLAHVDDTRGFLRGMATLVEGKGAVVVEAPYVEELLDRLEYDTIYHEHLCYFSVTALMELYGAAGLGIRRIDRVPVHGGSLRILARPGEEHSDGVRAHAAGEASRGLAEAARYIRFAEGVKENRTRLRALLEGLRADGRTVAAYGAPAKGNTLLNYCGIGPDLVAFTVDKNPLKTGRFTPGMHLPVLEVEALLERQPDYVMILAWNLADEIMRQEDEYRRRGGRFIIPIPEPRIVSER